MTALTTLRHCDPLRPIVVNLAILILKMSWGGFSFSAYLGPAGIEIHFSERLEERKKPFANRIQELSFAFERPQGRETTKNTAATACYHLSGPLEVAAAPPTGGRCSATGPNFD